MATKTKGEQVTPSHRCDDNDRKNDNIGGLSTPCIVEEKRATLVRVQSRSSLLYRNFRSDTVGTRPLVPDAQGLLNGVDDAV